VAAEIASLDRRVTGSRPREQSGRRAPRPRSVARKAGPVIVPFTVTEKRLQILNGVSSNCVAVSPAATITQSSLSTAPSTTTITFNASSGAGTYFIGIKYDSGSVKGVTAPTYDPVSYTFTTTEAGASSTQGLLLKKKV